MENITEKTEKSPLPVVAIDGVKIKATRETKKLTQLYVASVVGVTTDTISRWENNRYPTIKRDNAEKLASALEVELTEILQREEAKTVEEPPPASEKARRVLILAVVVATLALLAGGAVYFRQLHATPVAERRLPRFGAPGEIIPVQLRMSRHDATATGLIIRERLPSGWRLVNSMPPATTAQGPFEEVKWLIPPGSGPIIISYTVQIPLAAGLKTTASFEGEIVAHGGEITRREACGGDRSLTVAGVHWADKNGDGRIDDDEIMPAYYRTEEMKGLGLDWKVIEAIWSGKGYRWDSHKGEFEVVR